MKKTLILIFCVALAVATAAALTSASIRNTDPVPENVKALFGQRCAGCHKGKNPPQGLNLEPANIAAALDAPSRQAPSMQLIKAGAPESSYLLKKVRSEKGITGRHMPPGKALTAEEIQVLEAWIAGLAR